LHTNQPADCREIYTIEIEETRCEMQKTTNTCKTEAPHPLLSFNWKRAHFENAAHHPLVFFNWKRWLILNMI